MDVKDIIFEGLTYTVMGISIVFLVLIIIMLVIKAMAFFSVEKKAPVKTEEKTAENLTEAVQPEKTDDTELIAVITAAIAASLGTNSNGLVIRSYKKVSDGAWNKQGRREILDNRF